MSGKTANFKTKSSCVRQKRFLIMNLNPKVPGGNGGGVQIYPPLPVVFRKMYLIKTGWNPGFL